MVEGSLVGVRRSVGDVWERGRLLPLAEDGEEGRKRVVRDWKRVLSREGTVAGRREAA